MKFVVLALCLVNLSFAQSYSYDDVDSMIKALESVRNKEATDTAVLAALGVDDSDDKELKKFFKKYKKSLPEIKEQIVGYVGDFDPEYIEALDYAIEYYDLIQKKGINNIDSSRKYEKLEDELYDESDSIIDKTEVMFEFIFYMIMGREMAEQDNNEAYKIFYDMLINYYLGDLTRNPTYRKNVSISGSFLFFTAYGEQLNPEVSKIMTEIFHNSIFTS
jgi:hypothetical protein